MDYFRQIEEDLKALGLESKRKYPEVKDSTERASSSLKMMREVYIADLKRKGDVGKVKFPTSSDITAPYILACNHADGNPKMIAMALSGLHLLLNYDVIPTSDVKNILRVLCIQANTSKTEFHLKMLQILLQLVNLLSKDEANMQYMTETTVCSLLTLSLQLCDGKSTISVASTALSTARQVVSLIMEEAHKFFLSSNSSNNISSSSQVTVATVGNSITSSAALLAKDMALFIACKPGEWIRNVNMPQQSALDLMNDILLDSKDLFRKVPQFTDVLKTQILPSIKSILRNVQDDFLQVASRFGLASSAALSSRVIRLARTIILHYSADEWVLEDCDVIVTLLVHALQPDRSGIHNLLSIKDLGPGPLTQAPPPSSSTASSANRSLNNSSSQYSTQYSSLSTQSFEDSIRSRIDDATSLFSSSAAGNFMSKLIPVGNTSNSNSNSNSNSININNNNNNSFSSKSNNSHFHHPQTGQSPVRPPQLPGAEYYLTLVSIGPNSSMSSNALPAATQLPAHPAGAALEALLSFFLSDISCIIKTEAGTRLLISALINTIVSTSHILTGGLASETLSRDFEAAGSTKASQLMALLEGVLSGAESVTSTVSGDQDQLLRSVHELLINSTSIAPTEVLILSFQVLQVCVRLLIRLGLELFKRRSLDTSDSSSSTTSSSLFFISPDVLAGLPLNCINIHTHTLHNITHSVCENIHETILDACLTLLTTCTTCSVVKRSLGILCELALCTGVVGLAKPCNVFITCVCKLAVPQWHGHEMMLTVTALSSDPAGTCADNSNSNGNGNSSFKWRHMQALVRLLQMVHVLADVISDWDTIIDSIEQLLVSVLSKPNQSLSLPTTTQPAATSAIANASSDEDNVPASEFDKISAALDRFKAYSAYISDDSLVKLMSSLVALSLNNLDSSSSSASRSSAQQLKTFRAAILHGDKAPLYMAECIKEGLIGFSFQTVIEVTKLNAHRVSCIWQMVSSHLRMIASQKNSKLRAVAVAATHDIISSSLTYMMKPHLHLHSYCIDTESTTFPPQHTHRAALSDDIIFGWIFPPFDLVFSARLYHHHRLVESALSSTPSGSSLVRLSQSDLMSSLKFLSCVRYMDVKNGVIDGLLMSLQNGGQMLAGAWGAVVEIIEQVPVSMSSTTGEDNDLQREQEDSVHVWSKVSLSHAFSCIQLIVDEFLDLLALADVKSVILCLASFAAQLQDVNISLTSIEMLWKVTDLKISGLHQKGDPSAVESVLGVMLTCLQKLSMDSRPEIRHCAMHTLFGAITAHAQRLSATRWKSLFQDALFPLFAKAGERSALAMRRKEEAITPELKKGVKMTVHHSRDTAQKQWSETQVLALRGLSRVVKTCTKLLLQEDWFQQIWIATSEICKDSLASEAINLEVSTAGLDCMFVMLKIVSMSTTSLSLPQPLLSTPPNNASTAGSSGVLLTESLRAALWTISWKTVQESSYMHVFTQELALHFVKSLASYYSTNTSSNSTIASEFRYSDNLRIFLTMLSTLARPKGLLLLTVPTNTLPSKPVTTQLHRAILEVLKKIESSSSCASDYMAFSSLVVALAEITFANQFATLTSSITNTNDNSSSIVFKPCPVKLREEAGEMLCNLLIYHHAEFDRAHLNVHLCDNTGGSVIDIISAKFIACICSSAIDSRISNSNFINMLPNQSPQNISTPTHHDYSSSSASSSSRLRRPSNNNNIAINNSNNSFNTYGSSLMSSFSKMLHVSPLSPSASPNTSVNINIDAPWNRHAHYNNRNTTGTSTSTVMGTMRPVCYDILQRSQSNSSNSSLDIDAGSSTKSNSYSMHNTVMNYWTPLVFKAELKVMHLLLKKALMTQFDSDINNADVDNDWRNVVDFTACALSPWKRLTEVFLPAPTVTATVPTVSASFSEGSSTSSFNDQSILIIDILNHSFDAIMAKRCSTSSSELFISCCVSSIRLSITAVSENAMEIISLGEDKDKGISIEEARQVLEVKTDIARFYESIWLAVLHNLQTIIVTATEGKDEGSTSKGLSLGCVRAALKGLLQIVADLVNNTLMHTTSRTSSTVGVVCITRCCDAYLKSMVVIKPSLHVLPLNVRCLKAALDCKVAVSDWLNIFINNTFINSDAQSEAEAEIHATVSSTGIGAVSFQNQGHIIFLMPVLLQLLSGDISGAVVTPTDTTATAAVSVRCTAALLLASVDTDAIVPFIHAILADVEALTRRNQDLENEIISVKSAASLPF